MLVPLILLFATLGAILIGVVVHLVRRARNQTEPAYPGDRTPADPPPHRRGGPANPAIS
jgi:hypothetical protein